MSELSRRTHVPKETTHYYVREEFIAKFRKNGENASEPDESFVEPLLVIKEIEDRFFLPPSTVNKKILQQRNKFLELKSLLELRMRYFKFLDRFLQKQVMGLESLAKRTRKAKLKENLPV
ncbi:MAG: hypothetical protein JW836_01995 [Deltaproteobacteria bacterium]|nr:hypothetical protein [Deltaproteobacteria bacterium]